MVLYTTILLFLLANLYPRDLVDFTDLLSLESTLILSLSVKVGGILSSIIFYLVLGFLCRSSIPPPISINKSSGYLRNYMGYVPQVIWLDFFSEAERWDLLISMDGNLGVDLDE